MSDTTSVIIRLIEVFLEPIPMFFGEIIVAPTIIPYHRRYHVYLANGNEKQITLDGEMMSLERAWRQNLYGFGYSGKLLEPADLTLGVAFVSNLSREDTMLQYEEYLAQKDAGPEQ